MSTQTCFDMSLTGLSAFEKLVTFVREEPKHTVLSIIITSMYKQQSFHPSIVNLSLGFETPSRTISQVHLPLSIKNEWAGELVYFPTQTIINIWLIINTMAVCSY